MRRGVKNIDPFLPRFFSFLCVCVCVCVWRTAPFKYFSPWRQRKEKTVWFTAQRVRKSKFFWKSSKQEVINTRCSFLSVEVNMFSSRNRNYKAWINYNIFTPIHNLVSSWNWSLYGTVSLFQKQNRLRAKHERAKFPFADTNFLFFFFLVRMKVSSNYAQQGTKSVTRFSFLKETATKLRARKQMHY